MLFKALDAYIDLSQIAAISGDHKRLFLKGGSSLDTFPGEVRVLLAEMQSKGYLDECKAYRN